MGFSEIKAIKKPAQWNLAAIGTGVPNDWDSLIIKLWDR